MRRFIPLNRSWIISLLPAAIALAGCEPAPTEIEAPPLQAAPGGKPIFEKIAFASNHQGAFSIYVRELDGYDIDRRVTTPPAGQSDGEPDFAPGNKSLVFTRFSNGKSELYTVVVKGGRPPRQLTSFNAVTQHPVYSPNGSRIAFVSDKDGALDVYVMNADGSNIQRITTTPAGDYHPTWSPDGSKLAYAAADYGVGTRLWVRETGNWTGETLLDCPTSWCTSPTWSRTGNRIMYEEGPSFGAAPVLKLLDLDAGSNNPMPSYPSARVGGWKPNSTRFVFATTGVTALFMADTESLGPGQFYPADSPEGTIVAPTWSR